MNAEPLNQTLSKELYSTKRYLTTFIASLSEVNLEYRKLSENAIHIGSNCIQLCCIPRKY